MNIIDIFLSTIFVFYQVVSAMRYDTIRGWSVPNS